VPGQREEDIIQGWSAQRQIVQGNLRSIEIAYNFSEELCAMRYRHNNVAVIHVDLEFAHAVRAHRLHSGIEIASLRHGEFNPLASDLSFQFVGCAFGNHTPLINDGNLVGELISFLQLLRSD